MAANHRVGKVEGVGDIIESLEYLVFFMDLQPGTINLNYHVLDVPYLLDAYYENPGYVNIDLGEMVGSEELSQEWDRFLTTYENHVDRMLDPIEYEYGQWDYVIYPDELDVSFDNYQEQIIERLMEEEGYTVDEANDILMERDNKIRETMEKETRSLRSIMKEFIDYLRTFQSSGKAYRSSAFKGYVDREEFSERALRFVMDFLGLDNSRQAHYEWDRDTLRIIIMMLETERALEMDVGYTPEDAINQLEETAEFLDWNMGDAIRDMEYSIGSQFDGLIKIEPRFSEIGSSTRSYRSYKADNIPHPDEDLRGWQEAITDIMNDAFGVRRYGTGFTFSASSLISEKTELGDGYWIDTLTLDALDETATATYWVTFEEIMGEDVERVKPFWDEYIDYLDSESTIVTKTPFNSVQITKSYTTDLNVNAMTTTEGAIAEIERVASELRDNFSDVRDIVETVEDEFGIFPSS